MGFLQILLSRVYLALSLGYLLGYLIIGSLMGCIMPPFQNLDEQDHWIYAWEHSNLFSSFSTQEVDPGCNLARGFIASSKFSELDPRVNGGRRLDPHVSDKRGMSASVPDKSQDRGKLPPGEWERLTSAKPDCKQVKIIAANSILNYPGVIIARLVVTNEESDPARLLIVFYLARIIQGLPLFLIAIRFLLCLRNHPGYICFGFLLILAICLHPGVLGDTFSISTNSNRLALAMFSALIILFKRYLCKFDLVVYVILSYAVCIANPVYVILVFSTCAVLLTLNHGMFIVPALKSERSRAAKLSVAFSVFFMVFLGGFGMDSYLNTVGDLRALSGGTTADARGNDIHFSKSEALKFLQTIWDGGGEKMLARALSVTASYGRYNAVTPSEQSASLLFGLMWIALLAELLPAITQGVSFVRVNRRYFCLDYLRWVRENWHRGYWKRGSVSGFGLRGLVFGSLLRKYAVRLVCAASYILAIQCFWVVYAIALYLTRYSANDALLAWEHSSYFIPVYIIFIPAIALSLPGYASEIPEPENPEQRHWLIVLSQCIILMPISILIVTYALSITIDVMKTYH